MHHLELFYYVAKYEGITAAVRMMPFGIQQPAVSGQLLQLEKSLGVKLFNRRPFALTREGELLYDFVYPFFSRLPDMETRLAGDESKHLRIAAAASILRYHLPDVLAQLKQQQPELKLTLRDVDPAEIHGLLTSQEADVGLSVVHDKLGDGLRSIELAQLELLLLLPADCDHTSFDDLLVTDALGRQFTSQMPLISLPEHEVLNVIFQRELSRRKVAWQSSVEVSSLDMMERYVASGFGVGVAVRIPGVKISPQVKAIPLAGFPTVKVGLMYQGELKPIAQEFVDMAVAKSKQLEQLDN
ncbi:LysR family transcriptional regulator [Persicirhabdus sediminis]|uniref:LysR family transcriptional regulator n=1 Tax=Persicirhabdus sediminis TaxID=454144 RepID=A0A8J7MDC4_9BACT|nr:LysR family transcriptional regulator [Persicirhabdus sediminis]MBK1790868.1 LysR family transcriptional regulator [Persicirhabdus sediminis]